MKSEGQVQQDKGEVEGKLDSAADKAHESYEHLKKAIKRK
jgi:hypothetical protein